MRPIVSICIPAYKQTELLERSLRSILDQDFKDFELIISDDTPDNTIEKFVTELLGTFPFTYARNIPSLGTPANWNAAIEKAKGKYIKLMHHDDFFTRPDSLGLMVSQIEHERASLLFCQTDVWDLTTNSHRIHQISLKQLRLIREKPQLLFFRNLIGAPSATLYINNKSFKYDERFKWLVDVDLYLQYLFNSQKITYLEQPLICTATNAEGQVTMNVINDKNLQVREHVLLFNKIRRYKLNERGFADFFDDLFFRYGITTFDELKSIVPEADTEKVFYSTVLSSINSFREWKYLKKRFFESRYNNYFFKLERYL